MIDWSWIPYRIQWYKLKKIQIIRVPYISYFARNITWILQMTRALANMINWLLVTDSVTSEFKNIAENWNLQFLKLSTSILWEIDSIYLEKISRKIVDFYFFFFLIFFLFRRPFFNHNKVFSKVESNKNYGTATEHELNAPYLKQIADRYEAEYDYCMRWACDYKYVAAKVIPFQSNFYSVAKLIFKEKSSFYFVSKLL